MMKTSALFSHYGIDQSQKGSFININDPINFPQRPGTSSTRKSYNYFYDAKSRRNLQNTVNRMNAYMKKNNLD
jgi:hypothetical protein